MPEAPTTPWDDTDAVSLRRFLIDHPKVITELRSRLPKVSLTGTEVAALTGAARSGGENLIEELKSMTQDHSEPRTQTFIPNDQ